jgi:hypothetical protein
MRAGTEGATTAEQMTWIGEFPQEFYEDVVPAEVLEKCERSGDYCMISLGTCMTLRYGASRKNIRIHLESAPCVEAIADAQGADSR